MVAGAVWRRRSFPTTQRAGFGCLRWRNPTRISSLSSSAVAEQIAFDSWKLQENHGKPWKTLKKLILILLIMKTWQFADITQFSDTHFVCFLILLSKLCFCLKQHGWQVWLAPAVERWSTWDGMVGLPGVFGTLDSKQKCRQSGGCCTLQHRWKNSIYYWVNFITTSLSRPSLKSYSL